MTVIHRFLAVDYSTVIYALFNGFYEEFFFLGLLLSTDTKKRSLVLLFSTIVRTSFLTYQGLVSALVIGVPFGLFYYYMYKNKNDNLLPYFLAHASSCSGRYGWYQLLVTIYWVENSILRIMKIPWNSSLFHGIFYYSFQNLLAIS